MHPPATWTCRAPTPVTSAASLMLREAGGDDVHLVRGRSATGAWTWRSTGGQHPPFAIEARNDAGGSLVTRPDGVPFGRLEPVGRVRRRLDLHDHERRRARVRPDGRVIDEVRHTIARLSLDGDVVLELIAPVDDTLWALLIAALLHLAGCLQPPPTTSQ